MAPPSSFRSLPAWGFAVQDSFLGSNQGKRASSDNALGAVERFSELSLMLRVDTPTEKLEGIRGLVKELFAQLASEGADVEFECCNLMNISPAGLLYHIMYTIKETETAKYKKLRSRFNLLLLKRLHEEHIRLVSHVEAMTVQAP